MNHGIGKCSVVLVLSLLLGLLTFGQADRQSYQRQSTEDEQSSQKTKSKSNSPDVNAPGNFTGEIAFNLLNDIRYGLESHDSRLMMAAFDRDKFSGYLTFSDQLDVLFQIYDRFRVRFKILDISTAGSKASALVDFQLEEIPRDPSDMPQRKEEQIRFEFQDGPRGWKITEFSPRDFFS